MSAERPGELDRLMTTTEAIESLQGLHAAEEPLDAALQRVAGAAASAVPEADAVSITVIAPEDPRTAAYTVEWALNLDARQYSSGRGPCLTAAEAKRPVRVTIDGSDERWPEFSAAALDASVRASLSVPMMVDQVDREPELVGSLNIYSNTATAFDPFDEELMRLYTATASQAITNSRRWQNARDTTEQLLQALTSRSDIDQAKGALRAIHGYTADDAFDQLVESSQRRNVKLHAVAREFLESLRRD